jgi:hypothetical protein
MTYFGAGTTDLMNFCNFTANDITNLGFNMTYLESCLDRAKREIQERTKTHFAQASGTAAPDYVAVTNEKHDGQGRTDRAYYTIKYPLVDIDTYASGTVAVGAGTVDVTDSSDLPTTGIVFSVGNKITYTGNTGTALTGCTGITAQIPINSLVSPNGIEISTDDQGTVPTFTTMTVDDKYDADYETGRFYIYKNDVAFNIYSTDNPPKYTPNRVRLCYMYGWKPDSNGNVPKDVTRLVLMIAARDLLHGAVRKAHILGMNSFNPAMIDVDEKLINETIMRYTNPMFGNIH